MFKEYKKNLFSKIAQHEQCVATIKDAALVSNLEDKNK